MRSWRLAGGLRGWSSCQSAASLSSERLVATVTADASLLPSTSAPALPVTLRELTSNLQAPQNIAISALDAQLSRGNNDVPEQSAVLDGLLSRYVSRSSQPTPGQMVTIQLLRRYNGGMPGLKGQTILAKVLSIDKERILVDTGFHGLSELPRDDVTVSHIHTADGAQPPERISTNDIRPGDQLRLRLDALYTPYGDMQLTAVQDDAANRRRLVWHELRRRMEAHEPVAGRILNECPGGFSVGIAGFVARLPAAMAASDTAKRVGVRQNFLITSMDPVRNLIVLRDPTMQRGRGQATATKA